MAREALKIIHEEHRALAAMLASLRLISERLGTTPAAEDLLLGYEQLGAPRRQAFLDALNRYVRFYNEHIALEDSEVIPLALRSLTEEDWGEVARAFAENRDPRTGHKPSEEYAALFDRIVAMAPAPIGLGDNR